MVHDTYFSISLVMLVLVSALGGYPEVTWCIFINDISRIAYKLKNEPKSPYSGWGISIALRPLEGVPG